MSEFVSGHDVRIDIAGYVVRTYVEFPHVCPGRGCKVEAYAEAKVRREHYEGLRHGRLRGAPSSS